VCEFCGRGSGSQAAAAQQLSIPLALCFSPPSVRPRITGTFSAAHPTNLGPTNSLIDRHCVCVRRRTRICRFIVLMCSVLLTAVADDCKNVTNPITVYIYLEPRLFSDRGNFFPVRVFIFVSFSLSPVVTEKRNKAEKRVFPVQKKEHRTFYSLHGRVGSSGARQERSCERHLGALKLEICCIRPADAKQSDSRRRQSPPPTPSLSFVQRMQSIGSRNGTLSGLAMVATFPFADAD
jgi:hypothetical protein